MKILLTILCPLLAFTNTSLAFTTTDSAMNNNKVAVVGAGLAGLTTAYRLQQHGLDVTLYEAKNRVGGRAFTVLMENTHGKITEVELGGQNLTDGGEAPNIRKLLKELHLEAHEKRMSTNHWVCANEKQAMFAELIQNHNKNETDLNDLAQTSDNIGHLIDQFCGTNLLLKEALHARVNAYEGIDSYQQPTYYCIETLKQTLAGGLSTAHESYQHGKNEIIFSHISGGTSKLALALAKPLENHTQLNKILKKITTKPDSITLDFDDQSSQSYDFVVLATPASTFKDLDLSLSQIEPDTLKKIQSIQYGTNYKITFPIPLKDQTDTPTVLTQNSTSFYNHDDTIYQIYVNDSAPDLQAYFQTLSKTTAINTTFTQSQPTNASDEIYALYKTPVQHIWKDDPYAQGSYSGYSTTIASELDILSKHNGTTYKALFAPVNNKLFFAGEHTTITDCIGTLEGAVESGERIAQAIINQI